MDDAAAHMQEKFDVNHAGNGDRPGVGSLFNLLLPLVAGAVVHCVSVLSSNASLAAVALCLFSLVEPSCISSGELAALMPPLFSSCGQLVQSYEWHACGS
jgi:hypothetical protein